MQPALAGACDGSLACSTCHVILEQEQYDALPPPEEEEEDMLDLAFGLTDTSRLGCQITIDDSMKGMVLKVRTLRHHHRYAMPAPVLVAPPVCDTAVQVPSEL